MWYQIATNTKPIDQISLDERVIAYGDGFFTTMAVVEGQAKDLPYHEQRLSHGCQALSLTLDLTNVIFYIKHFAQQIQQGILKIIVCRQSQPKRGYGFQNCQCHVFIHLNPCSLPFWQATQPIPIHPPQMAICLSQKIACLPSPLAGLKLLNAQDKVLASHELQQNQTVYPNLIEGMVQNILGHWVEGTFSNFFYRLQKQWYTPPLNHSGVKGVMRQKILDGWQYHDFKGNFVSERQLTDQDLTKLTGLFFCNAVRGILPIDCLILPNQNRQVLSNIFNH